MPKTINYIDKDLIKTVNYSSREFITIVSDIKENLKVSIPTVNDFLESNEGRFLIDQWAGIADMLSFTIDRQAAENFIDTVETRPNLLSLLKIIGYQPKNPSPELVNVTFKRSNTSENLTIPNKTKLTATTKLGASVAFSTLGESVIPAEATSASVPCVQGAWITNTYQSNGGAGQSFILSSTSVAEGYIEVSVNGVAWSRAENNTLVGQSPTSQTFRTIPLSDKRMLVELGDNIEGVIPAKGYKIEISYLTTMHTAGHVNANSIRGISNFSGAVTVNNPLPSSGGADFEPIETARYRYPRVFQTMRRAVTLEDWEILAEEVPGVLKARAIDLNTDPSLPFFKVRLLVLAEGGVNNDTINKNVYDYLLTRRVNSVMFEVKNPDVVLVDVICDLTIFRNYDKNTIESEVNQTITDFFKITADSSSEIGLGRPVYLSRLITAINEVTGVSSVKLNSPINDIIVKSTEYIQLNSLNVKTAGVI